MRLTALSLVMHLSWTLPLFSIGCALGAYITGKTLADIIIPSHAIFRVCGLGLIVATLDVFCSFTCQNRLKFQQLSWHFVQATGLRPGAE
jgi:hypothetical protein